MGKPGNQYWKLRDNPYQGRPLKFATPELLWQECKAYFDWAEANPIIEAQAFAYQGVITIAKLPKLRAMTVAAMCAYIGIAQQNWQEYAKRPGFDAVCELAYTIIRTQKFEGAAAGVLNPVIIARDLGLIERSELSGPDGAPVEVNITDRKRRAAAALLLARKTTSE